MSHGDVITDTFLCDKHYLSLHTGHPTKFFAIFLHNHVLCVSH